MSAVQFTDTQSKFAQWLNEKGIYPADFAEKFGIHPEILTELVYGNNVEMAPETRNKIRNAIREIDPTANTYDFWSHTLYEGSLKSDKMGSNAFLRRPAVKGIPSSVHYR